MVLVLSDFVEDKIPVPYVFPTLSSLQYQEFDLGILCFRMLQPLRVNIAIDAVSEASCLPIQS